MCSRSIHGRKVDVWLIRANLQEQPIHRFAMQEVFDFVSDFCEPLVVQTAPLLIMFGI